MSKLNYSIITEIKKSNKGNVYLATVENYNFPVVVKEIKHGNINVFRALKEASSEYLPKIYHMEETEDGLLIVEEYVEGELLADYIAAQKLTESGCLNIAEQMCEALKVLHSHQPPIIHRDIKPSNVIISSKGIVKLIDFDSSRLYKAETDTDTDTRLLGTEKYAPPEQYGFSQTDCRSDIYSLGVVFEKFTCFMSKKKQKQWKRIVEKSTLFAPDSRFQTVNEIEQELKKIRKIDFFSLGKLAIIMSVAVLCVIAGIVWREFSKMNAQLDALLAAQTDKVSVENMLEDENAIEDEQQEGTGSEKKITEGEQVTESTESEIMEEEESLDDKYRTIPPEFRDLESDIPAYVSLKEHIREHHLVVIYYFKDRMKERDFLVHVKELDYETTQFHGLKLYSQKDGYGNYIEEKYVDVKDNIIIIDREYMDSLEKGYYTLATVMSQSGGEPFERGVYLYVAESDILEEPELWLQNTTYDYNGGESENIHLVVRNDSGKELVSLQLENGAEIDTSMYKVLQNGRVLEISSELLRPLRNGGTINYSVVCKDGSRLTIRIDGVSNSN